MRQRTEPLLNASLDGVKVHTGPRAAAAAHSIGARAFAHGNDIVLGASESPHDVRLLAHEAAHVVQQRQRHSAPRVQRDPRNFAEPLTDRQVAGWTIDELKGAEQVLINTLSSILADQRSLLETNLGLVQFEMKRRSLTIQPYWGMRQVADPKDRASPEQVAGLQVHIDLLVAVLESSFPRESAAVVARLKDERTKVESLHKDDVLREGDRLEASLSAVGAIGLVGRGLPTQAPVGLEAPHRDVQTAVAAAVDGIATTLQALRLREAQAAAERYVDAFSRSLILSARDIKKSLRETPASFPESNYFINGYARGGRIALGSSQNELSSYQFSRKDVLEGLDRLGDLGQLAGAPFADRARFLERNGVSLDGLLKRGQALLIMASGFQIGVALMAMVADMTDQVVWTDIASARQIRDNAIVPLGEALYTTPTVAALTKAQGTVSAQFEQVKKREGEIQEYVERVGTFMQLAIIAASLLTGAAAMEAAGGSGVTIGAAGMPQVALGQFVRGSLAFTMGSSMVTSVLTGQAPTPQAFVQQALMDMATLGLMHGVGVGLAGRFGGVRNVPVGVQLTTQFGVLWAWSAGMSLLTQPGPITPASAVKTIADAGTHTAFGMLALSVGHKIGSVPQLSVPDAPAPDVAARQRAAIAQFESVRARGSALEKSINEWGKSGQSDTLIEGLLRESEAWYGSYRSALKALGEAGILDPAQVTALAKETAAHVSQIRNVRDMGRLGLRETGESSVSFNGDVRNLDTFLGRLQRQETIKSYKPVGRSGMYEVVGTDGRVTFYYPEGPAPESGRGMNLAAEAIAENFPNLSPAVRTNAVLTLANLRPAEATRVALQLSGPGGEAVLHWLADVANRGGRLRFVSADFLIECAADPNLLTRIRSERPADIDAWMQTAYEKAAGSRGARSFMSFLFEVRHRRGTLQVKDASEAAAIVQEIADATHAFEVRDPGPSIASPGYVNQRSTADWVRSMQARGYGGRFHEVNIDGTTWLLQVDGGTVVRAWTWSEGNTTGQVDVARTVKMLRDGLAIADAAPNASQRAAAIEALKPLAERITFLRRVRAVVGSETHNVLERVSPPERTAPPDVAPVPDAPAVAPVPVTTRGVNIARRQQLIDRATAQGRLDDPLIQSLAAWNPRTGANAPGNPQATLDLVERQLNNRRDAAVAQYKSRFGAKNIADLRANEFGGLGNFGDYLAALSGKQGITLKGLRALGLMTQTPPGEAPIAIHQLLEHAPTAAQRNFVLEHFETIKDIPGAHRLLADMSRSRNAFRGGYWTLQAIERGHIKPADIAALEQQESLLADQLGTEKDVVRVYDVVLKDGRKLEMKSWTRWFPESIRKQFRRDVQLQTNGFADLDALDRVTWLFEGTPGITEMTPDGPRFNRMSEAAAREAIGGQMELGLDDAMQELKIEAHRRDEIRRAFREARSKLIIIDATGTQKK